MVNGSGSVQVQYAPRFHHLAVLGGTLVDEQWVSAHRAEVMSQMAHRHPGFDGLAISRWTVQVVQDRVAKVRMIH